MISVLIGDLENKVCCLITMGQNFSNYWEKGFNRQGMCCALLIEIKIQPNTNIVLGFQCE